jgi:hypothetical protein
MAPFPAAANMNRANSPDIESHYDIQPVIDIFASPDQRDLEEALRRTSTKS